MTPDPRFTRIPGTRHIALTGDRWITPDCLRLGRLDWDRSLLDLPEVAAVLRPGATVIDVGAYIGDTTRLFLDRGCRTIAFECQPDAFECLTHNCPDADCRDVPVGDGRASVLMQAGDGGNMGARQVWSGHVPDGRDVRGRGPVRTFRLDDLKLDACDFVKIDVEGFEPWVLAGMRRTIRTHRPVMFIEVNDVGLNDHGAGRDDIRKHLDGYDLRPVRERHVPFDWLCIPKGPR